MKKINKLLLLLLTIGLFLSCDGVKEVKEADFNIVPLPANISISEGASFRLSSSTKIVYPEGSENMKRNAEFLSEFISLSIGIKPSITTSVLEEDAVILSNNLQSDNSEAYQIVIDDKTININGASDAGVFYGIQTLRKATPLGNIEVSYPSVTINDEPRFGYRGMMLDIARHFEPVEFVKKYIDLIALHNINRFHWHLTDDQGWRIEIKKYPKLTEVGSMRKETVIGQNSGEFDGIPHGGFYTQEEIKEVVQYAADRYITVIPEVDLPGHMLAALTAYPEYGCTGGPYEVEGQWGVFDDVLCPGKENTFTFIEDVLTEVMELFPSEYIHIGGDECPKVRWEECDECQARIKDLGLKDDSKHKKEFYLQSYVTARVERFLNDHGRRMIGWDEILEGELAPNATVMSWRGISGGIEAAQMNHDVIMTPNTYNYFDYYQTQYAENEPFLQIGGYLPLERVYSFDPAPSILTPEQKKHIIGVQANLWAEYLKTPEMVEYMVLPRMAALSEVQWMQSDAKDYNQFLVRLPHLMNMYSKLGYNYATHIFDVNAELKPNAETQSLDITLSTIDDAPIYYTLDGSDPNINSTIYEGVINIKDNAEIRAVSIREGNKMSSIYKENVVVNKSTFKPATLLTKAANSYEFNGADLLVDGLLGAANYKTGKWIGFQGNNLEVVIDMIEPTEISKAAIRNNVVTGDWIIDASEIVIEASDDNANFSVVAKETIVDENLDHWSGIVSHEVDFDAITARYFKVTVKSGNLPEWHSGKGKPGFIFVDEVVLN